MKKNDFLLKLSQHTSKEEGERLYHYYSEIIEDRIEAGEDEETIIAGFGDVQKIIQESEATRKVKDFEEKPRLSTGFKAVIAVLLVFASPIVLAVLLPLVMVVFTLAIVVLVVLISVVFAFAVAGIAGVASIIQGVIQLFISPAAGLLSMGSGFVALGLGVVGSFLMFKLTKLTIKGIKKLFGFLIYKFAKKDKGGKTDDI